MKVKESYWHEAAKADKNDKPNWSNDAARARQTSHEQSADAANKARQSNSSTPKDEPKFADILESSAAKLQKPNRQQRDEAGDERRDDQKKEKKQRAGGKNKDSTELNAANDGKTEKYESSGRHNSSGGNAQNGFGASVNQLNLSENFAARSILHIADLERLVSTVRTQAGLGGKREIVLQLKRSVLEGLQVKITTGAAAGVQIEFLAANEKVRAQIANHSAELADILRGRGINLQSLTAAIDSGAGNQNSSDAREGGIEPNALTAAAAGDDDLSADNTFTADSPGDDGKIYQA